MKRALDKFREVHGRDPVGVIAHTSATVLMPSNLNLPIYRDPDANQSMIGLVVECAPNATGTLQPAVVMWFGNTGDAA